MMNHIQICTKTALWLMASLALTLGGCAESGTGGGGADNTPSEQEVEDETSGSAPQDEGGDSAANPVSTPCAEVVHVADPARAPVDIIWSIDTSGSMNDEVAIIEERMNFFAEFIDNSNLDYRVIVIGDSRNPDPTQTDGTFDICIGPPLSGNDTCPDADSDRYKHVRFYVHSDQGLKAIVEQYPAYQNFLREGASVHMIAVTDDESSMRAADFMNDLRHLTSPGFPGGITFHSIVSDHYPENEISLIPGLIELPAGCTGPYGDAEAYGEQYVTLSAQTGGIFREICTAEWEDIFVAIGEQVLASSTLPCTYNIPVPSDGLAIAYEDVTVSFEDDNGILTEVTRVSSAETCTDANGWYFDDEDNPTMIQLCESVCGDVAGRLQIGFGCVKG